MKRNSERKLSKIDVQRVGDGIRVQVNFDMDVTGYSPESDQQLLESTLDNLYNLKAENRKLREEIKSRSKSE